MAQLTTHSPGLTDASSAELSILQSAQDAAYRELHRATPGTPEYETLNAAALQATINLKKFVPEKQPITYWDGNEQLSESEYRQRQATYAAAGADAEEVNIVATEEDGVAPTDDPSAQQVDSISPIAENESLTEEELADQALEREFDEASAVSDFQVAQIEHEDSIDNAIQENDWRVRLHLAPDADYLYKAAEPGILDPLKHTDGIIFPYTPQIQVQYTADYENYDLVHSNYRGYFYKGSKTENIIITATFTANDVREANYLLASLHFLKSATKMFYGQDQNRGMPPPVCFLTGLGEFQFNNHPCAITSMHYNLPNDVDYIPCGNPAGIQPLPKPKDPAAATTSARLAGTSEVGVGGKPKKGGKEKNATTNSAANPYTKATYVPTKIDINFTMIPIQTRDQVSREFSLKDYANGSLLTKGFW